FKGSAIISAVFWEHDVFAADGRFLRNLVGLGAVSIERSKTRLGEDIAGDESAGSRGIPFRQSDVEDEEFHFSFMPAGRIPDCPGVPNLNPPASEEGCPESVTFECTNCPVPLPDTVGGIGEIANVNIPSGCSVADVNMLVDITHTYDGDLVVTLSSPALPSVPMWSGICGGDDNIQAILDDESTNGQIGTVCPPAGFVDYTTAPPGGMTQFEGEAPNGLWTLNITDQAGGDSGTLNTWALTFSTQ
ncbi:MAG: proprotein convertase P-domain-containing protein, partial [Anaerolineae bacterium]